MGWSLRSVAALRLLFLPLLVASVSCSGRILPGITVELEADQIAPLGGTMILRASVTTTFDAPDTEVYFELSSGIDAIQGAMRRKIALQKNVPQVVELQIQLASVGEQRVDVGVVATREDGGQRGAHDYFYLEVAEHGSVVRKQSLTPSPISEGMN